MRVCVRVCERSGELCVHVCACVLATPLLDLSATQRPPTYTGTQCVTYPGETPRPRGRLTETLLPGDLLPHTAVTG